MTRPATDEPPYDRRSNRRSFTDAEKLAIVMESEAAGESVAAVCRCHDIATSMVFRWRVQFGFGGETPAKLAQVKVAGKEEGVGGSRLVLRDLLPIPDGLAAVDLPDGRRVFAHAGVDPDAARRHVAERGPAMMIVPAGVQVHLALGYTDMRKGMDGLAALVQEQLKQDPFSGHLFAFRGRRASMLKVLFWDGNGLCLFTKRIDRGGFVWPRVVDPGGTVTLSPAQLAMLIEGIDWRSPERVWRPAKVG